MRLVLDLGPPPRLPARALEQISERAVGNVREYYLCARAAHSKYTLLEMHLA